MVATPTPARQRTSDAGAVTNPAHSAYIPGFDGLRTVAVGSVVLYHIFTFGYADIPYDGVSLYLANFVLGGNVGVDLFFALSGFLMTGILLEKKRRSQSFGQYFRGFMVDRLFRIYPLYVLFLALAFLSAPPGPAFSDIPWYVYLLQLQNFWTASGHWGLPLMDVSWSLAIEMQFYVLWAVAIWWTSEKTLKSKVVIGAVVLAFLCRMALMEMPGGDWAVYNFTFSRIDTLVLGGFASLLWREDKVRAKKIADRVTIPLLALSFVLLATGGMRVGGYFEVILGYPLIAFTAASVVLFVRSRQLPEIGVLEWPRVCAIGARAFGIYLLHRFAVGAMVGLFERLGHRPSESALSMMAFPILALSFTAILVTASYRFERWSVSLKKGLAS